MITNELEIRIINKIGLILPLIIWKTILVLWNIHTFEKKHTCYEKIKNDIFTNEIGIKMSLHFWCVLIVEWNDSYF